MAPSAALDDLAIEIYVYAVAAKTVKLSGASLIPLAADVPVQRHLESSSYELTQGNNILIVMSESWKWRSGRVS